MSAAPRSSSTTAPPSAGDPIAALLASPPDLPFAAALEPLRAALAGPGPAVVVTAPAGTGKTTLAPALVADALARAGSTGRVVVTQPRRMAARAAARRLAGLLGQEVGETIGYAVRGERRSGPDTRIEIVTAGLLLRRLQADPELAGIGAVILDEAHERALDSDLLLALLLDARGLREDLPLVAMSATLEAERLTAVMEARTVAAHGAAHPVEERWAPGPGRLGARGVPREFLAHVAQTTAQALEAHEGDALVFLPGAREVEEVVTRLRDLVTREVDVLALHGRLRASAQDAALRPGAGRRVVVSTNVAESSLTVPGVRIVVDSTLAREPRLDVARSMSGLVTVGASRSAGIQRAGRAGREGPGAVYRCCSPTDWARAPMAPTPEILTADLTRAALELAAWGVPDGAGLTWLDEPPAPAMETARTTLEALGLVRGGGITAAGRAVVAVPAEVRPARALLAAWPILGLRRAARMTALLTADLRPHGADLARLARGLREGGSDRGGGSAWRLEARRLERAAARAVGILDDDGPSSATEPGALGPGEAGPSPAGAGEAGPGPHPAEPIAGLPGAAGLTPNAVAEHCRDRDLDTEEAIALVAGLAQPQWIARRRAGPPGAGAQAAYATVAGTGLRLPADSPLADSPWLAVAQVERDGGRDALIRAAAPLTQDMALLLAAPWLTVEERTLWQEGRLRAERVRRLGAITLETAPAAAPGPRETARAVVDLVTDDGLEALTWDEEARLLRARLALLHEHLGEPWPSMTDTDLVACAETWLAPAAAAAAVGSSSGRFALERLDVADALRALLPWPQAARLEDLVPERLEVPSGSQLRVDYSQGQPVLAVAVQECFGWQATPRIVEGRVAVLLHLLSPARRPVAVTEDLASFWAQGYPQVRAELRGRYPKHAWPEDPGTVPPHRGTRRRST